MNKMSPFYELPPVSKLEARQAQEDAIIRYMAQGGTVEILKGRRNPKLATANGKSNSGMKTKVDPTARFPVKSY